jgi:hypothetical protein
MRFVVMPPPKTEVPLRVAFTSHSLLVATHSKVPYKTISHYVVHLWIDYKFR